MSQQSAGNIGNNLRAIREARGMSMASLAQNSHVSKAMISKVERGEGGISAETLGKLAEALDVGISDLLASAESKQVILTTINDQPVLEDKKRRFVRRALSPIFPGRGIDVVHNHLQPGGRTGKFQAHKIGVNEYIYVLSGALTVKLDTETYDLSEGDCLFFEANCDHEMINNTSIPVMWILVIDGTRYVRAAG